MGGGSLHQVIEQESEALILTRVAMGENSHNLNERAYIMWLIRLRAELGYKNAGHRGTHQPPDRWWDERTTIREEALCLGGCQFAAVHLVDGIFFTHELDQGQLSAMVYPQGEQLIDFLATYEMAKLILNKPMFEYPEELRGYDEFRSSDIAWEGTYYWDGGKPSVIFYREYFPVNVFRDVSSWDNVYWEDPDYPFQDYCYRRLPDEYEKNHCAILASYSCVDNCVWAPTVARY